MGFPVEWFDDADAVGLGGPADVHDGRVEPVEDGSLEYCHGRALLEYFIQIVVSMFQTRYLMTFLTCGMMTLTRAPNSCLTASCTMGDSAKPPTRNRCPIPPTPPESD